MANLDNYKIVKNLGSGAFGNVKRNTHLVAQHILTQQFVAIKIIKKQLAREQGSLNNIKREARYLKTFSHPNIIKL
jgi:serine/threonine protein kinase